MPDSLCLTVLKKFADLFAEILLLFLQILQLFRALGLSRTQGPPRVPEGPKALNNRRICRKICRNSANKSANFFKAVRHTLSGTVVKMLRPITNDTIKRHDKKEKKENKKEENIKKALASSPQCLTECA